MMPEDDDQLTDIEPTAVGEGGRAFALHTTCFDEIMKRVFQGQHTTIFTIAIGDVKDLREAILGGPASG